MVTPKKKLRVVPNGSATQTKSLARPGNKPKLQSGHWKGVVGWLYGEASIASVTYRQIDGLCKDRAGIIAISRSSNRTCQLEGFAIVNEDGSWNVDGMFFFHRLQYQYRPATEPT